MSASLGMLFVGVGGQGVLTATRLLGQAALAAGCEARVGQLHGMAQRGGSLESTIVLGAGETAYVPQGEVDVLVALEPLEAARALPRVTPGTIAIVDRTAVVPYSMTSRGEHYPELDDLLGDLRRRAGSVWLLDGTATALELGERRVLNLVMLGALTVLAALPFGVETLEDTLRAYGGAARGGLALRAFRGGRDLATRSAGGVVGASKADGGQGA